MHHPRIVAVGGFSSDVGKTTLVCRILESLPGSEAIKTTRGHYRSCGKDPHACCVSHLLGDEPLIRSGREETYEVGKDTGRYWDAGATNVHWIIATDSQVEQGINQALKRVQAERVIIEGNSFTQFVDVDYLVMVASSNDLKVKASAKRALTKASALYLSDDADQTDLALESLNVWAGKSGVKNLLDGLPVYTTKSFHLLLMDVRDSLALALT
jgi:molybdopterin-guanine dinucleotide biosynthesis protein